MLYPAELRAHTANSMKYAKIQSLPKTAAAPHVSGDALGMHARYERSAAMNAARGAGTVHIPHVLNATTGGKTRSGYAAGTGLHIPPSLSRTRTSIPSTRFMPKSFVTSPVASPAIAVAT
jgi:hypothetical protein